MQQLTQSVKQVAVKEPPLHLACLQWLLFNLVIYKQSEAMHAQLVIWFPDWSQRAAYCIWHPGAEAVGRRLLFLGLAPHALVTVHKH